MKNLTFSVPVIACLSLSILSMLASTPAQAAGDASQGKALYESNCFKCHDTTIHTRPERIIFSKSALEKRVKFCDSNAGTHWNEQQLSDVVEYLNRTFYKFE